jgi:hypothetical protein
MITRSRASYVSALDLSCPAKSEEPAKLGLTQSFTSEGTILLVPAWLLQVRGEPAPMAVVAVQPAFLGQPEPPSPIGKPGVGSVPGAAGDSGGTANSQQNTGAPAQVVPQDPAAGVGN